MRAWPIIGSAILGLAIANASVSVAAKRSVPRQLIAHIRGARVTTDVFLGNSLVAAGIDEQAFNAASKGQHALNSGLGNSEATEHYQLLLLNGERKFHRLFYGFFDSQLTSANSTTVASLYGNRAMQFFTNRDTAVRYLFPDAPIDALQFRVLSLFPMYVNRGAVWAEAERLRRSIGQIGMPYDRVSRFGRVKDFAQEDTASRSEGEPENAALSPAVTAIVRYGLRHGARVCFVRMPMPSSHRILRNSGPEWSRYEHSLRLQASRHGAYYLDASSWIDDSLFIDALHLSPAGAVRFSQRLAHEGEVE